MWLILVVSRCSLPLLRLADGLRIQRLAMLGELTNIPTDTLIDMLYVIVACEVSMTATEAAEIEQIQRELQRRGGAPDWTLASVH